MASQEHLQQLEEDEDDSAMSTSTSGDEDDDEGDTRAEEGSDDENDDDDENTEKEGDAGENDDGDEDEETSSESEDESQAVDDATAKSSDISVSKSSTASKPKIALSAPKFLNRKVGGASKIQPRIKLSLKLPTKKNAPEVKPKPKSMIKKMKLPMSKVSGVSSTDIASDDENDQDEEAQEVQAMVVDSDEAGEDDAVATAVPEDTRPSPGAKPKPTKTKPPATGNKSTSSKGAGTKAGASKTGGGSSKRRASNPSKQIRIPPIASPGLLMAPPPAGGQGGFKNQQSLKLNTAGLCASSDVFDTAMGTSGYSIEKRTQEPHRGSSVKRTVDDMFATNVSLALNFPELIPKNLMHPEKHKKVKRESNTKKIKIEETKSTLLNIKGEGESADGHSTNGANEAFWSRSYALPKKLIEYMEKARQNDKTDDTINNGKSTNANGIANSHSRKRKRPRQFRDMAPVSLTYPLPEDYIKKRLEYVKAVKNREQAIIDWQQAQEQLEFPDDGAEKVDSSQSPSENGTLKGDKEGKVSKKNPIIIPPIPEPPPPPTAEALRDYVDPNKYKTDKHPIYLPNTKNDLVAHLDTNSFHITEGRYFGLKTNFVADPNFVGANAPGIAAASASGGSGLATSTSGSGSTSGGMAFILSSGYHSAAAGSSNVHSKTSLSTAEQSEENSPSKPDATVNSKSSNVSNKKSSKSSTTGGTKPSTNKKASSSSKKSGSGLKPTKTTSDLRKVMEAGGTAAEKLKMRIIKAAVYASRKGLHGGAFTAPNGETYPDVNKAFALHAGIKPCQRCKSNKQGVYHCRLRRKHEELDYDGGSTSTILPELFKAPLQELRPKKKKKKKDSAQTNG